MGGNKKRRKEREEGDIPQNQKVAIESVYLWTPPRIWSTIGGEVHDYGRSKQRYLGECSVVNVANQM